MRINYDYIKQKIDFTKRIDFESIKTSIQNNEKFDKPTKEIGIDFTNYIKKEYKRKLNDFIKYSKNFYKYKEELIRNIQAKNVFIAYYYGVLENILMQIQKPEVFFDKYDIENKYKLLNVATNLSDKYVNQKNGKKIIKMSGFKEFSNRIIGSRKRKRTVFIDEAQDCHRLEKEILIYIFGSKKIVIANGGKEQLIRHVELCNWEVLNGNKLEINKYNKRNKSYRVKKTVVEFCNYVANHYKIDLNIEPIGSEDEGDMIVDFNSNYEDNKIQDIFKQLNIKGKINGCSAYERILILIESNSQRKGLSENEITKSGIINEYNNIESSSNLIRGKWRYLKPLREDKNLIWDGTKKDKSKLKVPSPLESRLIYYESCRGLESWSVACFSIDKFFKFKKKTLMQKNSY